jgi:hypothetical protein
VEKPPVVCTYRKAGANARLRESRTAAAAAAAAIPAALKGGWSGSVDEVLKVEAVNESPFL